jgi:hypothetical protein
MTPRAANVIPAICECEVAKLNIKVAQIQLEQAKLLLGSLSELRPTPN